MGPLLHSLARQRYQLQHLRGLEDLAVSSSLLGGGFRRGGDLGLGLFLLDEAGVARLPQGLLQRPPREAQGRHWKRLICCAVAELLGAPRAPWETLRDGV